MTTPANTRIRFSRSATRPRSHRLLAGGLCLLVLLAFGSLPLHAEVTKEYQLKAAFLYNFTKFVEWPADRFENETSPIVIGVFGDNPFGDALELAVADRMVNGRPISIRMLTRVDEARSVHVVFVGTESEAGLGELMAAVREAGVLTVGESPQFAALGGIIDFTIEGNRVRFEINQAAGKRAGLRISAQLLKLATTVRRKD